MRTLGRATDRRGAFVPALLVLAVAAACTRTSPPPSRRTTTPARRNVPAVRLRRIATLEQPDAMAVRSGDRRLFIAEKTGRVVALTGGADPTTVLDLRRDISLGSEQGLLGLAFSPDGHLLYVDYTDTAGDTRVDAFEMGRDRADPSSREPVLFVDQPYENHNGGQLVFGPDGDLYIGLGDGGSGGDPLGNGQSLSTLLGKILRVTPDGNVRTPYTVPRNNPFVGRAGARPEIWAYGLRNPWRFSFDARTGDLWIGDVGQSAWEEIDVDPAGRGGLNFGWNVMEGDHAYAGAEPSESMIRPVYEYPHDGRTCAVTGGYVYRGAAIRELRGWYVFADFCVGAIEALRVGGGANRVRHRSLGVVVENLASFGEDARGELYALSLSGPVYEIVPG